MRFSPGDIVHFDNAVAGKMKFHLCLCVEFENEVHSFIFLNSEGGYRDQFVTDCTRLPEMPESRTGKTVFDCPTVHRKSSGQLERLRPKMRCRLPQDVAVEFLAFAKGILSMTTKDKANLIAMLESIIGDR